MHLLVTGGTGYLGSELVRRALATGWEVTGTGTRDFDVRDAGSVDLAFRELRPDAVVHTAYRQSGEGFLEINRDGSRHVARAAASAGARLVHLSTDVVFDGRRGGYREGEPVAPVTAYGASKAEAEREVLAAHPDALVVRTSLLYGGTVPGTHERLALEAAAGRSDVTFFTDERRNPTEVGDLAAALVELLPTARSGILHVAGADAVSRCELARLFAGDRVRCGPSGDSRRPLDCTLALEEAQRLLRTPMRGARDVLAPKPGSGLAIQHFTK